MITHAREILIYYNPESSGDRKTIAHAQSLSPHIKAYAFDKSSSTRTTWQRIIKSLGLHPKDLLNKAHPYYQEHIKGHEFDRENWLTVLQHNPDLIKAPIAIRGDKAILCLTPTDILQLIG